MKTMVLAWACIASFSLQAQENQTPFPDLISFHTSTLFDKEHLLVYNGPVFPLKHYSPSLLAIQKQINSHCESVLTFAHEKHREEWKKIDYDEITPYSWQWISFKIKGNNSDSQINLCRPKWWIKEKGADKIGNSLFVDIKEFGIKGIATVENIYPNQIDYRVWDENRNGDYAYQPVIGKFIHTSNDVYRIYLSDGEEMGVTGNHPIWSYDRNQWVSANQLTLGEHVRTHKGKIKFVCKEKLPGSHTVYNLEVYRSHNYFVSNAKVLVHNGPPCAIDFYNKYWLKLSDKALNGKPRMLSNGKFMALTHGEKVGEDFNLILFYIERMEAKTAPGELTHAINELISDARKSGAKRIQFGVSTIIDPTIEKYFENIGKNFNGFKVSRQGDNISLVGTLDEIKVAP